MAGVSGRMPQQRYQALALASRVEAASPHELVTLLYEELVRGLDVVRVALECANPDAERAGVDRARAILVALDASLDPDRGGDLAVSLSRIYRSMQGELAAAVQARDGERLQVLRRGVGELLGAWVRIGVRQAA